MRTFLSFIGGFTEIPGIAMAAKSGKDLGRAMLKILFGLGLIIKEPCRRVLCFCLYNWSIYIVPLL